MPLYVVFIDFTKALDMVSRDGLWEVLKKFGCPDKFINIIQAMHSGMQAHALQGNLSCRVQKHGLSIGHK